MDSESAIAIYRCLAWPISRILYLPSLSIIFLTFEILPCFLRSQVRQIMLFLWRTLWLSELEFFHYLQHVSEKNRQWSTTAWICQNRNKLKTVWSGRLMVIPFEMVFSIEHFKRIIPKKKSKVDNHCMVLSKSKQV